MVYKIIKNENYNRIYLDEPDQNRLITTCPDLKVLSVLYSKFKNKVISALTE